MTKSTLEPQAVATPPAHAATAGVSAPQQNNVQIGKANSSGWRRVVKSTLLGLFLVAVVGLALAYVFGATLPGWASGPTEKDVEAPPPLGVELVPTVEHTLEVPDEVRQALGILRDKEEMLRAAEVPTWTRPLVLPGSTAFDPSSLTRVRIRFTPAEVAKIGRVPDRASGKSTDRELRAGDQVKKGDLLCVLYSADVGAKKNDLIDALVQLKLDEEIYERAKKADGSVPEVFILNARRNVEADRNTVARALNTLKAWNIPEEDIQAVYQEVEEINKRGNKRDQDKERQWGRVELRAPEAGTIVERNLSLHEPIIDNTLSLFQIAQVERLLVICNAAEDDLPRLVQLMRKKPVRWVVQTQAGPQADPGKPGEQEARTLPEANDAIGHLIDDISYMIDVNQHSAVVKGTIPNLDRSLRAGQFVTATIALPAPEDVVEIPISALVDDGRQCVVFVQADAKKQHYTMRRVEVTHRFEKTAFVRSKLSPKEQQLSKQDKDSGLLPLSPLVKGEVVLTAGVLELKKELEDREAGR